MNRTLSETFLADTHFSIALIRGTATPQKKRARKEDRKTWETDYIRRGVRNRKNKQTQRPQTAEAGGSLMSRERTTKNKQNNKEELFITTCENQANQSPPRTCPLHKYCSNADGLPQYATWQSFVPPEREKRVSFKLRDGANRNEAVTPSETASHIESYNYLHKNTHKINVQTHARTHSSATQPLQGTQTKPYQEKRPHCGHNC